MCARRSFVSLLFLFAACRCGDEEIVVPVANGIAIAPWAKPELYLDRLEQLDARTLLVSWTDPSTDLAKLREAVKGREIELIIGLHAANLAEDEHNTPAAASSELAAALDRALVLDDELDGVHLDHHDSILPQNLDAT